jgi:periplasmic divalent cation tolerance protein
LIRSIYRWEGEIYDRPEGRVALHTRQSLIPTIVKRTRKEHPYRVPGIFALPIIDGTDDYIAWILQETLPI